MKSYSSHSELPTDLQNIYAARFATLEDYRTRVWQVLTAEFFSQWVKPADSVLDLGCGYGEFINNIKAREKFAMDLNPSARDRVAPDVRLLQQDCSLPWPLADDSLDVVFTSNFFEHLPTKEALQSTLVEALRCLKPQGCLIALGPNVKFLAGRYWDYFDHHLPLTELSLREALTMTGYSVEWAMPKFLPYTMSQDSQPPIWTLRLYLKLPFVWRFFGRQFLVLGRKSAL
jgi:SAM-dependent methyltransferase